MNFYITIPKNWNPDKPKAFVKWLQKLDNYQKSRYETRTTV